MKGLYQLEKSWIPLNLVPLGTKSNQILNNKKGDFIIFSKTLNNVLEVVHARDVLEFERTILKYI